VLREQARATLLNQRPDKRYTQHTCVLRVCLCYGAEYHLPIIERAQPPGVSHCSTQTNSFHEEANSIAQKAANNDAPRK